LERMFWSLDPYRLGRKEEQTVTGRHQRMSVTA